MEARYFLLIDSEEKVAQASKIYMEPGDDSELVQLKADVEPQGLEVREVEKDFFLYILAEAGVTKVEFKGGK